MGRPRKSANQGLPKRVYLRSGTFYFVHPDGRWQNVGRDLEKAREKAEAFLEGRPAVGTVAYWLQKWHTELAERVETDDLAERTREDYVTDSKPLAAFFGEMEPLEVGPHHVAKYLRVGRTMGRKVRVNREQAAFSSFFTWLLAFKHAGVVFNPCRGVTRNTETKRARYISDEEFSSVLKKAGPAETALAWMIYRTLQRPSDILRWTQNNLKIIDGVECLEFRQSKTKTTLRIVVTETLREAMTAIAKTRKVKSLYLIPREDGRPYTLTGIGSMFRKATVAAGVKDFAPYDLKAKGATDLYEGGTPLEDIRALCGHESVTTTEIYIKRHSRKTVKPNDRVPKRATASEGKTN